MSSYENTLRDVQLAVELLQAGAGRDRLAGVVDHLQAMLATDPDDAVLSAGYRFGLSAAGVAGVSDGSAWQLFTRRWWELSTELDVVLSAGWDSSLVE